MKNNRIAIEAKEDFLEQLSSSTSIKALAELIWNGLDAGANKVDVNFIMNQLDGLEEIHVNDDGSGIPHARIQELFGNLGDSWKKQKGRLNGRALHGKNGQGRFKAFALGNHVIWDTVYSSGADRHSYQVKGMLSALDSLTFTNPKPIKSTSTGTNVLISQIGDRHGSLLGDEALLELSKLFAVFLCQYPGISILINGSSLNPVALQDVKKDIQLQPVGLANGSTVEASVSIIEWRIPTKRLIYLCDKSGVSLHEMEAGVHAPGFHYTAYVQCDHFRELDKKNDLLLEDLHADVKAIMAKGKDAIRSYFRKRSADRQCKIVERWKQEQIYPYEDRADLTPVEEAERQVFDILGVNLETYLPKFEEADQNSRKFTFMLLAQALKENPRSVQKIIAEVLNLKKEEQEELAALLDQTTLSNIISTAKTVANRLDFLVALENLLFNDATKPKLLERDQLHKILEREAWIFDEEFALSASEESLEEVLRKHIGILGKRQDGETAVDVGDGKTGRIDLQLSRTVIPRSGEKDYLVVELKRPTKKIDEDVITQVKKYANAVANDERFHGIPAKWKFVAVSNDMNEFARNDATQPDRPKGQVWISPNGQITAWVREWAEVINTAKARLQFINESLSYEADRDSAKEYLKKTHEKFIPELEEENIETTGGEVADEE